MLAPAVLFSIGCAGLSAVFTVQSQAYFRRTSSITLSKPQLSISKAGDHMVRRLLVNCAHYILGHWGPDCDLRRWGVSLMAHGGKNAKKRAVVAVARKLAVLMHKLWVTGEVYEPLRQTPEAKQTHVAPAA